MEAEQLVYRQQILKAEEQLLNAFKHKDIPTLDELIHEQALFVLPNGLTVTKSNVLDNYRNGDTNMTPAASDQAINIMDHTAVVSMTLELKGKYLEQEINSQFRYLRVWKLVDAAWKVIATSGVPLNDN